MEKIIKLTSAHDRSIIDLFVDKIIYINTSSSHTSVCFGVCSVDVLESRREILDKINPKKQCMGPM